MKLKEFAAASGPVLSIVTALALASVQTAPAAWAGEWTEGSRMEEGRVMVEAAVVGSDIYVAGGSALSGPKSSFDLYDTLSNMWRPLPPMPSARERFGMTAFSGRVYIAGGRSADIVETRAKRSDELWAFDTTSRDWVLKMPMPTPRVDHAMVSVNDKIYVIGGTGPDADRIYVYDIVKDSWSTLPGPMPNVRKGFGVAVDGSKVYLVGGVTMDGALSSRVDIFDTQTEKWSRGVSIPTARVNPAASFLKGRLHITGGSIPDPAKTFNQHFSWAPGEETWRTEEGMPTARHAMASAVVDGKWYVLGGGAAAGFYTLFAASDSVEVFKP